MSVVWSHGKKLISINDFSFIIIETKSEEGYKWNEITFKSIKDEDKIYIGSYYTYNYSSSSEWMEYNSNFIVLLAVYLYGRKTSDLQITRLFDVNSKKFIEGSQEELFEIYNQAFKETNKKKVLTHK